MTIKPDDRTEINPRGGYSMPPPNNTKIDPPHLDPAKDNRFSLSQSLVAKIEAIARARVKVARFVETPDLYSRSSSSHVFRVRSL